MNTLKYIDKKNIKTLILFFIVLIVLTVVIKSLFFYKGIYFAPKKGVHDLDVSIESVIPEFKDTFEKTEGIVLFDLAHENDFDNEEIYVLISRIIDRGNKVEFLTDAKNLDRTLRKETSFLVLFPTE